ncbi:AMP-dependent synthetase and ligase [Exidia glandulosa HHB12029]|uniref:AMP-dependent synthetase and ligase n=1 Tax=Exidia glandulosa HHB12029 TaxID=1314781 RepID=A0A165PJT7_EXIGL|nr:AMP-dependent synthetase and ligase [Exidia glandulosa HHB12029]
MPFEPTPASIPPPTVLLRQDPPTSWAVNYTALNPLSVLLRAALIYPDKPALIHEDVPRPVYYTYAVWAQRVQNLAYALRAAGIRPGDRVAVVAPNCPLIADAHYGVLAARAILTSINYRLKKHEIHYILEHSGAKIVIVDHEYAHLVRDFKAGPIIVSDDTGREGCAYEDFLASGRLYSDEKGWRGLEMEPDESAGATLCYTSGTTGRPKGVLTTLRGAYLAAVANAYESRLTRESVYLWQVTRVLPMFHAAGWCFPWATVFAFATQVTIRSVNNTHIWNHFLRTGVTHYCGAPTVQIGLINAPEARRLDKTCTAIIAGSAPTAALIAGLEKLNIATTYGPMTRNYPQPAWAALSAEERSKLVARQGHAFATADEVRVVQQREDDEIVDVPLDAKSVGEVVMRGNIVMQEYFSDENATRNAFRGGYFRSGDLAVRHPDGNISILDRSKDIIISGGENASSLAIEQELAAHPDVLEVSVVARPHPRWGERPMAFVVLRPGKDRDGFEERLNAFARERLAGFECPDVTPQVLDGTLAR